MFLVKAMLWIRIGLNAEPDPGFKMTKILHKKNMSSHSHVRNNHVTSSETFLMGLCVQDKHQAKRQESRSCLKEISSFVAFFSKFRSNRAGPGLKSIRIDASPETKLGPSFKFQIFLFKKVP